MRTAPKPGLIRQVAFAAALVLGTAGTAQAYNDFMDYVSEV